MRDGLHLIEEMLALLRERVEFLDTLTARHIDGRFFIAYPAELYAEGRGRQRTTAQ